MKYTEKVQIYNKFTKHYTRPMLQTDEIIMYFSPYTQISQHVNMENHNKTCPSFHATTVVCITLKAQQISNKQKYCIQYNDRCQCTVLVAMAEGVEWLSFNLKVSSSIPSLPNKSVRDWVNVKHVFPVVKTVL